MDQNLNKNTLGFSLKGLIILSLVLLPNLLFYAFVIEDSITGTAFQNNYKFIGYAERTIQMLLMLIVVFRVNKKTTSMKSKYVYGMAVFLMLYYALWLRFFTGGLDFTLISENFLVSMGMAIFPAIYFVLAEAWRRDYLGVWTAITFGLFHALNTYLNFAS